MILLDLSLKNNLYIVDIFDAALQELEILFETNNCELLGDSSFGTNFDQYLWSMTPTTTDLKDYISGKLNETTYISKLQRNVTVEFIKDEITYETIYLVKIALYNDNGYVEKEIKLTETDL